MTTATRRLDSAWFVARIADVGVSQRALAERIGLQQATLCRMLQGKRRMQIVEARALADALAVPFADVLRHAGVSVRDDGDDIEKRHRAAVRMVRTLMGVIDEHGVQLPDRVRKQAGAID